MAAVMIRFEPSGDKATFGSVFCTCCVSLYQLKVQAALLGTLQLSSTFSEGNTSDLSERRCRDGTGGSVTVLQTILITLLRNSILLKQPCAFRCGIWSLTIKDLVHNKFKMMR